jgi:hypothetical protein
MALYTVTTKVEEERHREPTFPEIKKILDAWRDWELHAKRTGTYEELVDIVFSNNLYSRSINPLTAKSAGCLGIVGTLIVAILACLLLEGGPI